MQVTTKKKKKQKVIFYFESLIYIKLAAFIQLAAAYNLYKHYKLLKQLKAFWLWVQKSRIIFAEVLILNKRSLSKIFLLLRSFFWDIIHTLTSYKSQTIHIQFAYWTTCITGSLYARNDKQNKILISTTKIKRFNITAVNVLNVMELHKQIKLSGLFNNSYYTKA